MEVELKDWDDGLIYNGPSTPNAINTVTSAITCYEGKTILVSIVEVKE